MADNTRSDFLPKAIRFAAEQAMRLGVRVSVPGVVKRYDSTTKRAVIQPAIMRDFKDGRPSAPVAPLVDVPVVSSATGGFLVHQQINEGDIMLVLFTDKGLDDFKLRWSEGSEPTKGKFFADAVAIRWGDQDIEPVSDEGICLQSADGNASIVLKQDSVEMRVGRGRVRLTDSHFDTWRA